MLEPFYAKSYLRKRYRIKLYLSCWGICWLSARLPSPASLSPIFSRIILSSSSFGIGGASGARIEWGSLLNIMILVVRKYSIMFELYFLQRIRIIHFNFTCRNGDAMFWLGQQLGHWCFEPPFLTLCHLFSPMDNSSHGEVKA